MEAVATTGVAPPGRPGWWRTTWALGLGWFLGYFVVVLAVLPASLLAGVTPFTDGPDHGWPFVPAGPFALAADLGFAAFVLALMTVVARSVLSAWVDQDVAPTWVALALGLGGLGPFFAGALSSRGTGGFLVALIAVRYGAFDADGRARPGVLDAFRGRRRAVARRMIVAVPVLGLVLACAYGITNPVRAPASWSGAAEVVPGSRTPARSFFLPLSPQGLGDVTVLAVRTAGDARSRTRVLAAGEPAFDASSPPRGLPVSASSGVDLWLSAPRCPALTIHVDRFDVRVRSWSGTHWVPLRLEPAARVRCVP